MCDKLLKKKVSRNMDRKARDEVVFWFVVLGHPQKLRTAMSQLFTGDPELVQFLSRDLGAPEQQLMVKKNAFRLLQLHRYLLCIACFVLCKSLPEAVNVCRRRIRDPHLALLLCRLKSDAVDEDGVLKPGPDTTALLSEIQGSAEKRCDYWLLSLLAWQQGDYLKSLEWCKVGKAIPRAEYITNPPACDLGVDNLAFCTPEGIGELEEVLSSNFLVRREAKVPNRS